MSASIRELPTRECEEPLDGLSSAEALKVDKKTLVDRRGVRFADFRRTLARPRYAVVWRDIALVYLALLAIGAGAVLAGRSAPALVPAVIPLCALAFGYAIHSLMLFFHEAAHYNIAPRRDWNDRLANLFICSWIGMEIKRYRIVHFDHHRYLGTTQDREISYFFPLDFRTLVEAATGIRILRYFLNQGARPGRDDEPTEKKAPSGRAQLALGLALNGALVGTALALGAWALAVSWVLGLGLFAPVFQVVRQTLEHRDEHADGSVNYTQIPHGEVNRLFGDGPIARSFGAAGFNRHLLHHWDPQLSYTRLAELEAFLLDCDPSISGYLRARSTTYQATFRTLFRWR